jgi:hypothetical protein
MAVVVVWGTDCFKNSVRTSKRTQHLTIKKLKWLMLFDETTTVYTDNDMKTIKTRCSGKN